MRLFVSAFGIISAILILSSCASIYKSSYPSEGNSIRIMNRPDFEEAAKASPKFIEDVLLTINDLEYQLQFEKSRN